jgi:glycosyltransferase involved in cell wall biosynthesis
MRTWLLARELARRGHEVTWWHSTFSHQTREKLAETDSVVSTSEGFRLALVEAGTYRNNYSIGRLMQHRRLARGFERMAARLPVPDVIVCAYPPIELAERVARYANANGIRLIVDARDYWPDTFPDRAPKPLRALVDFAVRPMRHSARATFNRAGAIVAMSREMLEWAKSYRTTKVPFEALVVPLGSEDVGPFLPRARRPEDSLNVFFGGTLGNFYDLDTVLAAAERLQSRAETRIRFVVAGSGTRMPQLAQSARGLSNVELTGWLETGAYRSRLAEADVGLMPYSAPKFAAFPNKAFEYFSAGLPTVSSCDGEMRDVLEAADAGTYYLHDDVNRLVEILIEYADYPDRVRLQSSNARRLFEEYYDAGLCYPRYADFVEGPV